MRKERAVAWGLFSISVLYFVSCMGLKLGALRKPGPGLFPSLIAVALLLSTGAHLYKVFRKEEEASGRPAGGPSVNLRTLGGLSAFIVVYPALLMSLDFVLSTFLTVFGMLLVLRFRTWPASLFVSLFTAIACFFLFAMLLGVALPSGVIETFLYKLRG